MARARADISRARGAVRRTVNALAELRPVLAVLEELAELPDHIGRYTLAGGEEFDEGDVLDFLRLARAQHPRGTIEIVVLGRSEESLSEVTGHQATHSGGMPHGNAGREAGAVEVRRRGVA
jgi:hypothetical protein